MQVVCEATQSASSDVQVAAYECLVKIMHEYYDFMKFYMERALFGVSRVVLFASYHSIVLTRRPMHLSTHSTFSLTLSNIAHSEMMLLLHDQLTVLGMKSEDEKVALQAVEFWSTVCDEEIELALEAEEAAAYGDQPERESHHFARAALPEILPVLLLLLTQQEEDASDDEWNVSMAAGTALALLAQCVGDGIVTPVIPFVEGNIKSADWRFREAAVMAFGSILDGPEDKVLTPLVDQALPILIEMMRDPSLHVRDTTAWTLGRISDVLVKTIKVDLHLPPLVTALVGGLQESPRIVSNCCWSLMNLAEQLGDRDADTSVMSPYYAGVVEALVTLAEKYVGLLLPSSLPDQFCSLTLLIHSNASESNSRTSAYEALSTLVQHASKDCLPVVERLVISILARSETLLGMFVRCASGI